MYEDLDEDYLNSFNRTFLDEDIERGDGTLIKSFHWKTISDEELEERVGYDYKKDQGIEYVDEG